jgi:hypothetical protein
VIGMDCNTGHTSPQDLCSTASNGDGRRCKRRVDGLTLATVVIALAGFVGTAAFATPVDCNARAAPSATAPR